ncbi:hypothetical protein [Helicobacter sp.]|uniref:hypothetical protein n=1 Tax=Helicobacter sp. TaxID=218 RepID=UPI00375336F8|nr:hypothetical protein [Helicobacter sp.]
MIVPILVAIVLRGSGHINAGFSFVMTCGGISGALSGSSGGFVAQYFGYFSCVYSFGQCSVAWVNCVEFFLGCF